jgi:methyltransferase (TIGR00027 family)
MKNIASGTAEGVAYMRYYESLRPIEKRICNDYIAYQLTSWWVKAAAIIAKPFPTSFMDWAFEKKGIGVSGFIAVRTRAFDEFILKGAQSGCRQLVILGAGLDSRAYRFKDELAGIRVFEVDHPLSQAVKKKRLEKCFGNLPEHVSYVPVDFNSDDLFERLGAFGYDPGLPGVFTMEGVVEYLPEESVRETLAAVIRNSGRGSSLIMDYVYRAAIDGRIKNRVISHMNSLKFIFNEPVLFGIENGEAVSFLRNVGFDRAEDFTPKKLYETYLKPTVPERTISDVYGIAAGYID